MTRMLIFATLVVMAFYCKPLPDANKEFDRLSALPALGNLTPAADLPQYAPYNRTLLDKYLQNPGKLTKFLAYFI